MEKYELINTAIEALNTNPQIIANWDNKAKKGMDGNLIIKLAGKTAVLNYKVYQELRQHQIDQLEKMALVFNPFIVVAIHIFPKIKEELQKKCIAYLEANGNIYLQQEDIMLWLDAHKPFQIEREKRNRAFSKTNLKIIFHFLLNEKFVNLTYREIAGLGGVGLGNINYVMNGLKEAGYLIKLNKEQYKLTNKKELLNKWISAYSDRLRPSLKIGSFRFLKEADFNNWKTLPIQNGKTWWGGEPAADLMTNNLRPAVLTIYTTQTRNELIKNCSLIPDDKGNVKVYQKFWNFNEDNNATVPPLLVYADLLNTNDRRCIETAQKIYDEYLQNKF